jgi:hypothetical protein
VLDPQADAATLGLNGNLAPDVSLGTWSRFRLTANLSWQFGSRQADFTREC